MCRKGENKNEHLDWFISDPEALDKFIRKKSIKKKKEEYLWEWMVEWEFVDCGLSVFESSEYISIL